MKRLLGNLEPETIRVWKELLIDLEFKYFRKAVVHICKTYKDFYPGTSIPGSIREEAKRFKSEEPVPLVVGSYRAAVQT